MSDTTYASVLASCACCGKSYKPRSDAKSDCCSRQCYAKHYKALGVCSVYAGYCVCCGSPFVSKRQRMHCSDDCERESARSRARLADKERYEATVKPVCCKQCAESFVPEYGEKKRTFCSKTCAKRYAKKVCKQRHGGETHRKRARRYGVLYEPVNPLEVFERDGWKCRICGVDTPKEKRGTFDDDAPELDHVDPISKGGSHTYSNMQCLCRKCNGLKSDKPMSEVLADLGIYPRGPQLSGAASQKTGCDPSKP